MFKIFKEEIEFGGKKLILEKGTVTLSILERRVNNYLDKNKTHE